MYTKNLPFQAEWSLMCKELTFLSWASSKLQRSCRALSELSSSSLCFSRSPTHKQTQISSCHLFVFLPFTYTQANTNSIMPSLCVSPLHLHTNKHRFHHAISLCFSPSTTHKQTQISSGHLSLCVSPLHLHTGKHKFYHAISLCFSPSPTHKHRFHHAISLCFSPSPTHKQTQISSCHLFVFLPFTYTQTNTDFIRPSLCVSPLHLHTNTDFIMPSLCVSPLQLHTNKHRFHHAISLCFSPSPTHKQTQILSGHLFVFLPFTYTQTNTDSIMPSLRVSPLHLHTGKHKFYHAISLCFSPSPTHKQTQILSCHLFVFLPFTYTQTNTDFIMPSLCVSPLHLHTNKHRFHHAISLCFSPSPTHKQTQISSCHLFVFLPFTYTQTNTDFIMPSLCVSSLHLHTNKHRFHHAISLCFFPSPTHKQTQILSGHLFVFLPFTYTQTNTDFIMPSLCVSSLHLHTNKHRFHQAISLCFSPSPTHKQTQILSGHLFVFLPFTYTQTNTDSIMPSLRVSPLHLHTGKHRFYHAISSCFSPSPTHRQTQILSCHLFVFLPFTYTQTQISSCCLFVPRQHWCQDNQHNSSCKLFRVSKTTDHVWPKHQILTNIQL